MPIVAVSAPAGIALGTPLDTTIAAGEHIDAVAQKNLHMTAGEKMNLHAAKCISQFAIEGGIKSIAHAGPQIIQAQNDDVQIAANQGVNITASNGHVLIAGKTNVTLASGGAYIKIADGNIQMHCPGTLSIKRGHFVLAGPDSMNVKLPVMPTPGTPDQPYSQQVDLSDFLGMDPNAKTAIESIPYEFRTKSGKVLLRSVTNDVGDTARVFTKSAEDIVLYVGDGDWELSLDCYHEYPKEAE